MVDTTLERIPVSGPSITAKEIAYVTDAVTNAWYGKANLYHDRFEKAFAAHLGTRFAMALPSCTSAIHLSLLSLGIKEGDEVIVPESTWIASSAPITYVGATPVFADVDPRSWCISVASVEEAITPRTRAVIPVDLYGNVPDLDALRSVCRKHQIAMIEDAAQAIGTMYQGRKAGSLGDLGVFSFHGSKTVTTGEGGMLVTDRQDLFERAQFLRDHGRKPGDRMFYNAEVAHKYKMSSMQAALGLAQLERIDELVAHKRRVFDWYRQRLADVEGLLMNDEAPGVANTYWMVTVIPDDRYDAPQAWLMDRMAAEAIDTRPFFHPLSSLPAYAHLEQAERCRARNPVSYRLNRQGINLPSGMDLTESKVDRVCRVLKQSLGSRKISRS
jgi:perosamine synthetase